MSTKKNELIVFGYIRCIEKKKLLTQIIPMSIATVIMLFFPWIDEFKWNKDQYGTNIKFIDDTKLKPIEEHKWSIAVGSDIISSDLCNWYQYEFELQKWSDNVAIEFGFIETPINETIKDWEATMSPTREEPHFSINICCLSYFRLFGKDIITDNVKNAVRCVDKPAVSYKMKPKNGDRFKTRIDFKERCIKLWYNDEYVNSVYKGVMPLSVVVAFALSGGEINVINTDWE